MYSKTNLSSCIHLQSSTAVPEVDDWPDIALSYSSSPHAFVNDIQNTLKILISDVLGAARV